MLTRGSVKLLLLHFLLLPSFLHLFSYPFTVSFVEMSRERHILKVGNNSNDVASLRPSYTSFYLSMNFSSSYTQTLSGTCMETTPLHQVIFCSL